MEKKVAKKLIEAALGSIKDNMNSVFYDEEKSVRYDFSWAAGDDPVRAIVTRNEWNSGASIMSLPSRMSEFMLEVTTNTLRMLPVPPAKTFRSPPESERVFFESVVRAYFAGRTGEHDYVCWERVSSKA